MSERSDNWYYALLYEACECLAVCTIHISYKTEVNHLFLTVNLHLLQRALVRTYNIHICACETNGIDIICLKLGYKVLVYKSAINHCYNLKHLGIGNAATAYHNALYAE